MGNRGLLVVVGRVENKVVWEMGTIGEVSQLLDSIRVSSKFEVTKEIGLTGTSPAIVGNVFNTELFQLIAERVDEMPCDGQEGRNRRCGLVPQSEGPQRRVRAREERIDSVTVRFAPSSDG